MSAAFGGLLGTFILLWGTINLQTDLTREQTQRQDRLEGIAHILSQSIDGELHATFRLTADMQHPEYNAIIDRLIEIRETNDLGWVGTTARDARNRDHFVFDGGTPPAIPVGYPIFDWGFERNEVYEGHQIFRSQIADEWGTWTVAMAPIVNDDGVVVGVVEVMEDAAWQELYTRGRIQQTGLQAIAVIILSFLLASFFARRFGKPLKTLTEAVLAVADGNLDRSVIVETRDEFGALASAFNVMVEGLRERKFIRDTFERFVSQEVADRALKDGGQTLGGDFRQVTILYSDLRGFSALTRRLGPSKMISMLNRYISAMTDVIIENNGHLSELLGDGLVVLFGAPQLRDDDASRAVRCAIQMQRALVAFNERENASLEMGIGIGTGVVIAGNIGSEKRMKYGVVGSTINLAARLQSLTVGSQVLISARTHRSVRDANVEVGKPLNFLTKGWPKPIECYPVLAVGDIEMPATITFNWSSIEMKANCHPISGKKISDDPRPVKILSLANRAVRMSMDWQPTLRDQMLLRVDGEGEGMGDVYGVITNVTNKGGWAATLRISSISPEGKKVLQALINHA